MSLAKGTIRAAFGEGESGMNPRRQAETAPTAGDGPRSRREGDGGNKKTPKANNLPCITLNADSLNSTWAVLDSIGPNCCGPPMAFNKHNTHYFSHGIANPPINAIPKHATRHITIAQVINNFINNPRQEAINTTRNAGMDVCTAHKTTTTLGIKGHSRTNYFNPSSAHFL